MKGLSVSDLKILKSSPHVSKITKKHIIFTDHFKWLMLESSIEGLTRQEVFNKTLGVNCFDKSFVDNCLGRWRRKIRFDGDIKPSQKGRKTVSKDMTIEEMRAQIAYQKEVIAHLKKLRGLADDEL